MFTPLSSGVPHFLSPGQTSPQAGDKRRAKDRLSPPRDSLLEIKQQVLSPVVASPAGGLTCHDTIPVAGLVVTN